MIGRHPGTRLSPLHLENTYDYGDTCTYFISLKINIKNQNQIKINILPCQAAQKNQKPAKSFICNLRAIGGLAALSNMIFVTTDDTSRSALLEFVPEAGGIFLEQTAQSSSDINYGTVEYFGLIIERLTVQHRLLKLGVNVAIVEADQIWFKDAGRIVRLMQTELPKHDVVAADDNGQQLIAGGFVGVRSSERMLRFFESFVSKYKALLEDAKKRKGRTSKTTYLGDVGESHQMSRMLKTSDTDVRVKWLDTCDFARGEWYKQDTYRRRCPSPWLVTNNWIIGNSAKVERAKKWNHWYLSADQKSCIAV